MSLIEDVATSLRGLSPGPGPLRRFGLLVGAVLLAAGLWLGRRGAHPSPHDAVALAGAALLLLGAGAPATLRTPYRIWMGLAFTLGWFTSRLLLAAIYLGVLTPIGLLARVAGKRFLDLGPDGGAASYWVRRDPSRPVDHRKLS
jgi:hypothetical protein